MDGVTDHDRGQLRFATALAQAFSNQLLYVHGVGWYEYDGMRWARDRDGAAMRAAIDTVRLGYATLARTDIAEEQRKMLLADIRKCESAAGLEGILRIASALYPLAKGVDDLDPDPLLLNTESGTLDLRDGQVYEHDPQQLITKVAGCSYDPTAAGPTFDRFLEDIQPDPAMRAFLARVFGHALEGQVVEHVLPVLVGVGRNGKSSLVEAVMAALGDYAIAAEPDLLVEVKGQKSTAGQADLLGVRLAVCSETDEGRRLASATVKRLTGGDRITARRLYKDFVTFDASHTVVLVTNHRPKVAGDDDALWRRLQLVPFDVKIAEPDLRLKEKLALELPAILAWLVAGYRDWNTNGLAAPASVQAATSEYQQSSDELGRFIDECCLLNAGTVRARELYGAWSAWCHVNGETAGSEVAFAAAMKRHGFEKGKTRVAAVYQGLTLLDSTPDEADS